MRTRVPPLSEPPGGYRNRSETMASSVLPLPPDAALYPCKIICVTLVSAITVTITTAN